MSKGCLKPPGTGRITKDLLDPAVGEKPETTDALIWQMRKLRVKKGGPRPHP